MTSKHKTKILYIITKSNWGGAQRYVYDLATALDKELYEPIVALGGDGILLEMLKNAGITTIQLSALENKTGFKSTWLALREMVGILRSLRPDVVHLNSSVAGLIGAVAAKCTRVPKTVFTAHGWAFNEDRSYSSKLVLKTLHYLTVLLTTHTIAVSSAIVEQMNWPGAKKKMLVINPGRTIGVMFEPNEAREKICDFFPRLTPYRLDPWLICVAELHPIKRHRVLFEAVRSLTAIYPDLRLLCFGDGRLKNELNQWVKNHGMADNIFILGNLHEAARFLKAGNLFVLASKSESYGYVIHEAGLAHLPIVATNVGGITDIVNHNDTGLLVPPDNLTDLAMAINTTLKDTIASQNRSHKLYDQLSHRTVANMVLATTKLYH